MKQFRWNGRIYTTFSTRHNIHYLTLAELYDHFLQPKGVTKVNMTYRMRKLNLRTIRSSSWVRLRMIILGSHSPHIPVCCLLQMEDCVKLLKCFHIQLPTILRKVFLIGNKKIYKHKVCQLYKLYGMGYHCRHGLQGYWSILKSLDSFTSAWQLICASPPFPYYSVPCVCVGIFTRLVGYLFTMGLDPHACDSVVPSSFPLYCGGIPFCSVITARLPGIRVVGGQSASYPLQPVPTCQGTCQPVRNGHYGTETCSSASGCQYTCWGPGRSRCTRCCTKVSPLQTPHTSGEETLSELQGIPRWVTVPILRNFESQSQQLLLEVQLTP